MPFLEALRDRAQAEGNSWLAERLDRHASDERRHGQIFAHALKQLNKQVIDFKKLPQKMVDGRPMSANAVRFLMLIFRAILKSNSSRKTSSGRCFSRVPTFWS